MTDPPELSTSQNGGQPPVASIDAITTLIHSFASMITAMEARITARIVENAEHNRERMQRWEKDFTDYRVLIDRRIELLEGRMEAVEEEAEHEAIVWDARLSPIRQMGAILGRHWKDFLLALFVLLGLVTITFDILARYLGLPS